MLINNIIRKTKKRDRYNCLTFSVHERYQSGLDDTNTFFYMLNFEGMKPWNNKFAKIPKNHMFLENGDIISQIPHWLEIDFILSQNKFGNYQAAKELQRVLHVPIIQLEHTLPPKGLWEPERITACREMVGDINVFISKYSMEEWGFSDEEVIHHCVSDSFTDLNLKRKGHVLSIVNDFIGRNYFCGYDLWVDTVADLEWELWGDTKGLSKPTNSVDHLIKIYNTSQVFLNTSLVSPIPTVLLEAMACGCAPVSTSNCMIPEIITHGENGLLGNTPEELNSHCKELLSNDKLRKKISENAKQTIREMFSKNRFTTEWNNIFERAANTPYLG